MCKHSELLSEQLQCSGLDLASQQSQDICWTLSPSLINFEPCRPQKHSTNRIEENKVELPFGIHTDLLFLYALSARVVHSKSNSFVTEGAKNHYVSWANRNSKHPIYFRFCFCLFELGVGGTGKSY